MLSILGIFLVALIAIAYYTASYIVNANVYTKEQSRYDYQESDFSAYEILPFSMQNKEGNALLGLHVKRAQPRGLIILAHGFKTNHYFLSKQALLFLELGFDTLLYSHVHFNNYYSKKCGMGGYESDDLDEIVQLYRQQYEKVGTYGISMGGATVLLHSAKYGSADFCISESAYASLRRELRFKFRRKLPGLGPLLLPLTRLFIRLLGGYDCNTLNVSKALISCDTPIMLIHGSFDPTVHIEDGLLLAKRAKNCKRLYICNGGKHTNCLAMHPQRYQEELAAFLAELG